MELQRKNHLDGDICCIEVPTQQNQKKSERLNINNYEYKYIILI